MHEQIGPDEFERAYGDLYRSIFVIDAMRDTETGRIRHFLDPNWVEVLMPDTFARSEIADAPVNQPYPQELADPDDLVPITHWYIGRAWHPFFGVTHKRGVEQLIIRRAGGRNQEGHRDQDTFWRVDNNIADIDRAAYDGEFELLGAEVFDPNGQFGIWADHEDYSVMGGEPEFMNAYLSRRGGYDGHKQEFLDYAEHMWGNYRPRCEGTCRLLGWDVDL
jgi:hypothetical protein